MRKQVLGDADWNMAYLKYTEGTTHSGTDQLPWMHGIETGVGKGPGLSSMCEIAEHPHSKRVKPFLWHCLGSNIRRDRIGHGLFVWSFPLVEWRSGQCALLHTSITLEVNWGMLHCPPWAGAGLACTRRLLLWLAGEGVCSEVAELPGGHAGQGGEAFSAVVSAQPALGVSRCPLGCYKPGLSCLDGIFYFYYLKNSCCGWGCSSVGRALASNAQGPGFTPSTI